MVMVMVTIGLMVIGTILVSIKVNLLGNGSTILLNRMHVQPFSDNLKVIAGVVLTEMEIVGLIPMRIGR